VVSVGASGAIFGIYALLLTVMWKRNDLFRPEARRNVLKNGALVIGYNLFIGFVAPEIDNAAHVGGFLAGATSGFIIAPKLRRPKLPQP
ncbi:MAG TPA: rhomboid family intramembrane serine protease, partial [Turneriella sp.]|nr:rhomboid family intramembrane serine protease [Turneriella sp.]